MKRTTNYEAHDGKHFTTAEECREHETKIKLMRLVNMSDNDVMAAIERHNPELALAIEFAGNLIAERRRSDGVLKRRKGNHLPAQIPDNVAPDYGKGSDEESAQAQAAPAKKQRSRK
jgi:hypothetical protein